MLKGRGSSRGTTLIIPNAGSLTDSTLLGFNGYPMITEEAGSTLSHRSPHQAHPLTLGVKGPESMVLIIVNYV